MASSVPTKCQKMVIGKTSFDFREAVSIISDHITLPAKDEVLVRNKYVGINAADLIIAAGKHNILASRVLGPGSGLGFEGIGKIVAVGSEVTSYNVGDTVAYMYFDAFSEYTCVPQNAVFHVPDDSAEYIPLVVGGLTAAIGLDKAGRITEGEKVLVTAAAGGTGHIAVQWAKAAGCHVIGTCSTQEKVDFLKELGCDRIINYTVEDLETVLTEEYPEGIDVIWETIGGKVLETCIKNLANFGRLLTIGQISSYKGEDYRPTLDLLSFSKQLVEKSASFQGFLVLSYTNCHPTYFNYLKERKLNNEIQLRLDTGKKSTGQEFFGLEGVIRAVEHLYTRKTIGKIVVRLY